MRRTDREINSFEEIVDVLRRANTIRLGLKAEPYPYVVPLSFGLEAGDGKICLYFHGASEGFKHELIAKNPLVCAEADIFHAYEETPNGGVTTRYESVIGFGKAELVSGGEAAKGMDLILAHCGYEGFEYDCTALERTWIYKITLASFSGKRNLAKGIEST